MKVWNNVTVISNFDELKQAVYKRFILGYDSKIMVCSSIHLNQTAAYCFYFSYPVLYSGWLNWQDIFIPDTFLCLKPTVFTVLALLATVGGYNSKFPKLTRKSAVNPWNIYLTPMSKRTQIPLLLWYTSAQKNSKFGVLSLIYSQLNTLWEITIYPTRATIILSWLETALEY